MDKHHILVIEDDPIVGRTISRTLKGDEFRVSLVNSGVEGLNMARRYLPDMIVLDVMMPGMNGFDVCREIRNDPIIKDMPILFLTAKIKDEDRVMGLKVGADDFLCKPFNIDEFVLRLRAILRRTKPRNQSYIIVGSEDGEVDQGDLNGALRGVAVMQGGGDHMGSNKRHLEVGEYSLDTNTFKLDTPHSGRVSLTPMQYNLLYHLMCHPGEVFSTERLLEEVWDFPTYTGSSDLVRVHIKNLRRRIEEDSHKPKFICTVPGYGYMVGGEED